MVGSLLFFEGTRRRGRMQEEAASLRYGFAAHVLFRHLVTSARVLICRPQGLLRIEERHNRRRFQVNCPITTGLVRTMFRTLRQLVNLHGFKSCGRYPFEV